MCKSSFEAKGKIVLGDGLQGNSIFRKYRIGLNPNGGSNFLHLQYD